MPLRLTLAGVLALAAAPALGATVAEGVASFAVSTMGELPPGVTVFLNEPSRNIYTEETPLRARAEAFADGDGLSGEVSSLAVAEADASGEAGAYSYAEYFVFGYVENVGAEAVTVPVVLDYELFAFAALDDPAVDDAFASASAEVRVNGDEVFLEELLSTVDRGLGEVTASGPFSYDLTIPALSSVDFGIGLIGVAGVEDASPIPLPAALPLLVAALGGLALLRRRA